jgi:RNA polymerase sigma-70 factor (ECF subfamily)
MRGISDDRALWLARNVIPHEPALRAWLRHKRVVGLEIDDIVQETYARLAAAETLVNVRNPKTYAFQTAYSIVLTHLRRARVVSIRTVEDVDVFNAASEDVSPERQVSDREELHRLAEAVATLPDKVRAVFVLRRVDGLPQRDVAVRLGLSESTVEKHMAKALRLLADWFGRGGNWQADASNAEEQPRGIASPHDKVRNGARD